MSYHATRAIHAAAHTDQAKPLTDLRERLATREAVVRDNQKRAYLNHNTLLEADYMGEQRGLRLALSYIEEALRTATPTDTEETQP